MAVATNGEGFDDAAHEEIAAVRKRSGGPPPSRATLCGWAADEFLFSREETRLTLST
jgi:hypothetical protein